MSVCAVDTITRALSSADSRATALDQPGLVERGDLFSGLPGGPLLLRRLQAHPRLLRLLRSAGLVAASDRLRPIIFLS
jgi:hypothetical protein